MSRGGLLGFFRIGGLALAGVGVLMLLAGNPGGGVLLAIGAMWFLTTFGMSGYYGRVAKRLEADRALFDTGERAVAVVEQVEGTASYINEMPVVWLHLRVRRANGDEFPHRVKIVTLPTTIPPPGHVIDVALDPKDLGNVVLDTDPRLSAPPGVVVRSRPPTGDDGDDDLDRLERLHKLHKAGVLTDAEFADQKARILEGRD